MLKIDASALQAVARKIPQLPAPYWKTAVAIHAIAGRWLYDSWTAKGYSASERAFWVVASSALIYSASRPDNKLYDRAAAVFVGGLIKWWAKT